MKRKIISLLLCLVMALSLIPTVAFGVDDVVSANHIDVRVDAKLTIEKQVNGATQSGYPKDYNVKVTSVTGTVNGNPITFSKKQALA